MKTLPILLAMLVATAALADPRIEEIRTLVRGGDAERAEELAEALVEAEPDNPEAHNVHGEVLSVRINEVNVFRKMGMAGDMRKAWERAIELDPAHLDAHMSLLRYYLQAPAIAGGGIDKAKEQAKRIATVDRPAGFRAEAAVLASEGKEAETVALYQRATAEFPDDFELHYMLGLNQQRAENWDAALASFNRAVEIDPAFMNGWYQIGRNAVLSGTHLEEGVAALRKFIDTPTLDSGVPPPAWAHTRLGQVYRHMGRTDDARSEFKKALALDPKHEEAKKQLAALDRN